MSSVSFLPPTSNKGTLESASQALRSFEDVTRLRRDIERSFSRFDLTPEAWLAAAIDYFQLHAQFTAGQVVGLDRASYAASQRVLSNDPATATSYVNLATIGPEFHDVGSGVFEIIFGAIFDSFAGGDGFMAFSVNGAVPSDNDAAFAWMSAAGRVNIVTGIQVTLTEPSNSLVAKYRVSSGMNTFRNRWAVIKRVGNA